MKCPNCNFEIKENSKYCSYCGKFVGIDKYIKMRKCFSVIDFLLGLMFLIMILQSNGGIENNSRMMGTSWFFMVIGIVGFLGSKNKIITIFSLFLYGFAMIYNLFMAYEYIAHISLFLILLIFFIFICISFSSEKSFK